MPKGDKFNLKADPDDGTTPIAHLLLEALAMAKLNGKEKGAVLFLWRVTYGWLVDGQRLKEREVALPAWATVLQTDEPTASKVLSNLIEKRVVNRCFSGPGGNYTYSMNTRVDEWDNSCINHQGLKELSTLPLVKMRGGRKQQPLSETSRGGLSKTSTHGLSKTSTPPASPVASPKAILNQILNKAAGEDISKAYLREIFAKNPDIAKEWLGLVEKYPEEWLQSAFSEAANRDAQSFKYVLRILERYEHQNSSGADPEQNDSSANLEASADLAEPIRAADIAPETLNESSAVWNSVLVVLQNQMSEANYRIWFKDTHAVGYKENVFLISTPNAFIAKHLENNMRSLVEKTMIGVSQKPFKVAFVPKEALV